jgi:protein-tyrosine phosphatase
VATDWLTERQRDGGIDEIPLAPGVPGALRLCGKHAIGPARFADPDVPWSIVVCLCERHELVDRYPDYVSWLDRPGDHAIWWPVPDLHAPPADEMVAFCEMLAERLRLGRSLLVHCAAGIGRSGTTAVCILLRLGVSLDDAQRIVGAARPGAGPEVGPQRDLVHAVAAITGVTGKMV